MSFLQLYKNDLFEVAATVEDDQILFDVEKVARCLGITQKKNGVEYIRWERVNEYLPKNSPQVGKGSLVPEPFVYKLAFKASNEVAEMFQDWLAMEVIPSIRKNGGYLNVTSEDNEAAIMAKALLLANRTIENNRSKIEQQNYQLAQQQPKVLFADSVAASNTSILIRELAKLISQSGVKIGEKGLFQWLRENGYLIKKLGADYNTPTQKSMNLGLFEIKETTINRTYGIHVARTPKVTGKGQIYFVNKFLELIEQKA
ncbi:phage antirepressor Ant [Lysinibacillus boronitolerans]|uniref:phage antirepressor Ant n=1 Tax=Lysinibacillus boronitolerans TaxID=309788 RepID=UPI00031BB974|nr:phage antirepressor Ant [Lysinibacillus boronitolerans]